MYLSRYFSLIESSTLTSLTIGIVNSSKPDYVRPCEVLIASVFVLALGKGGYLDSKNLTARDYALEPLSLRDIYQCEFQTCYRCRAYEVQSFEDWREFIISSIALAINDCKVLIQLLEDFVYSDAGLGGGLG